MTIRIKGVKVQSVEDTETKRLKIVKLDSKSDGITLTLEVPEALCAKIADSKTLDVVIDSKPITRGKKSILYMEGTVFKQKDNKEFEAVATMGGLRLVIVLKNATPAKKKIFDSESIFLALE